MTPPITACLVTRGDCDMQPILDTLIFDQVIIWDNSVRSDLKTFGRYAAAALATTPVIYFQDDDCLVPAETQEALAASYEPGLLVANWGHGDTPAGYDDIALFHGGGIVDRQLIAPAFSKYLEYFPRDEWFLYEADFIFGCLAPHKHVHLPIELRENCFNGERMCDQPWQREKKLLVSNRARWVRDHASGQPSTTDTMSVTTLTRAGVTLSQAQKDEVKALDESGHTLEAQKIILGQVAA